jgi:hypothetical protein
LSINALRSQDLTPDIFGTAKEENRRFCTDFDWTIRQGLVHLFFRRYEICYFFELENPMIDRDLKIAGRLHAMIAEGKTLFFLDNRGHWREAVCFHGIGFRGVYAVAFQCAEQTDDETWYNKTPMTAFPLMHSVVKAMDDTIILQDYAPTSYDDPTITEPSGCRSPFTETEYSALCLPTGERT